jgi:hypothetical protein
MLTCGPRVSERKGRAGEGERTWAGLAERERKERERGKELGLGSWAGMCGRTNLNYTGSSTRVLS